MNHTPAYLAKKRAALEQPSKPCARCGEEKPRSAFPVDKHHLTGLHAYCHSCIAEKHRIWYAADPDSFKRRTAKWAAKNPEKVRAHDAVKKSVLRGQLPKAATCQVCGSSGRIEAHHWKGYDRKYWLDIQWLCHPCHEKADRNPVS